MPTDPANAPNAEPASSPSSPAATPPLTVIPPVPPPPFNPASNVPALLASDFASQLTEQTRKDALGKTAKDWPRDWTVLVVCAALSGFMLWKAGGTGAVGLPLKTPAPSIPTLFGTLLLVSLFVERVIEVFVSVWEDRETSAHEQNLDYWQARQGRLKLEVQDLARERDGAPAPTPDRRVAIEAALQARRIAIEEAAAKADVEEKALLPFEARTRKVATWIGLVVGLFVAAVGFRFLEQIVEIASIYDPGKNVSSEQYNWFVAADVLLTGTVLAGGSKLVHQIFAVYNSFMDASQKSLSDRSKTS